MRVWYIDGSPYARVIRATLIEFGLDHEAIELKGFPPEGIEELTPAWQVPVLEVDRRRLFGSEVIRAFLHEAHAPATAELCAALTRSDNQWQDAQVLSAIQTLADALVIYFHFKWAGAQLAEEHMLGVDIIEREMARAVSLLDWLEDQAGQGGFRDDGLSAQDLALAATILWTEARDEIAWHGRPKLEAIVAKVDGRDSFLRTAPRPWATSPKGRDAS